MKRVGGADNCNVRLFLSESYLYTCVMVGGMGQTGIIRQCMDSLLNRFGTGSDDAADLRTALREVLGYKLSNPLSAPPGLTHADFGQDTRLPPNGPRHILVNSTVYSVYGVQSQEPFCVQKKWG